MRTKVKGWSAIWVGIATCCTQHTSYISRITQVDYSVSLYDIIESLYELMWPSVVMPRIGWLDSLNNPNNKTMQYNDSVHAGLTSDDNAAGHN